MSEKLHDDAEWLANIAGLAFDGRRAQESVILRVADGRISIAALEPKRNSALSPTAFVPSLLIRTSSECKLVRRNKMHDTNHISPNRLCVSLKYLPENPALIPSAREVFLSMLSSCITFAVALAHPCLQVRVTLDMKDKRTRIQCVDAPKDRVQPHRRIPNSDEVIRDVFVQVVLHV